MMNLMQIGFAWSFALPFFLSFLLSSFVSGLCLYHKSRKKALKLFRWPPQICEGIASTQ